MLSYYLLLAIISSVMVPRIVDSSVPILMQYPVWRWMRQQTFSSLWDCCSWDARNFLQIL